MKIVITCFLLSTIGLTYGTSIKAWPFLIYSQLNGGQQDDSTEMKTADDDIADLQGVFNILEEIEMERAKQMQENDDSAMAQFWAGLGTAFWTAGKGYLKNRYCTQEAEVRAMIEELVDEQEILEGNEAVKAFNELRNLVKFLQKETSRGPLGMVIDGDVAKAEGWLKNLHKRIKKKAKRLAVKLLC